MPQQCIVTLEETPHMVYNSESSILPSLRGMLASYFQVLSLMDIGKRGDERYKGNFP